VDFLARCHARTRREVRNDPSVPLTQARLRTSPRPSLATRMSSACAECPRRPTPSAASGAMAGCRAMPPPRRRTPNARHRPAWRSAGELTYPRDAVGADRGAPPASHGFAARARNDFERSGL